MVAHVSNPNILVANTGGLLWIVGQPGPNSIILPQKKRNDSIWHDDQWAVAPATKSHHLGLVPETLVVEGESSLTHIMACEQPNSRH